jgi:hypothetical protein
MAERNFMDELQHRLAESQKETGKKFEPFVALADSTLRQFHDLRAMTLEVQPKWHAGRQLLELLFQVYAQLRVFGLGLGDQVGQSGQTDSGFLQAAHGRWGIQSVGANVSFATAMGRDIGTHCTFARKLVLPVATFLGK